MPTSRIFLSHSSKDKAFVDRLAADLERVNVGIWYDKWEIKVGDSLLEKISEGIKSHDYLALILSPNSVQSDWVRREVNAALMRELEEKRVVVLPILITDCEVPILLKEKKWADFRRSYDEGFEEFLFAVSPESPKTILRSKNFRTAQYLISGLASTDVNGTNTLNASQLTKLYPYRKELESFVGVEEKRVLFWSALAFRHSNPLIPSFIDISTPVWGLSASTTSALQAQWIFDGLQGVLFDYLIPYFRWAQSELGDSGTDQLKTAFVTRQELGKSFLSPLGSMSEPSMLRFLEAIAKFDRTMFDERFLPNLDRNLSVTPLILEATASLSPKLDDSFYFSFLDSVEPIALAVIRALARTDRTIAVNFLEEYVRSGKKLGLPTLDAAFSELGRSPFAPELRKWLEEEPPIAISARLLVALVNANTVELDETIKAIKQLKDDNDRFGLMPTLIRVYGRIGKDPENLLEKWLHSKNPVIAEAAIFAIARVEGLASYPLLTELLDCATLFL